MGAAVAAPFAFALVCHQQQKAVRMTQAPPFKLAPVGGKFDVARIMPWVARNYGVSQTRQLAEMARLAIPPYRMTPDEYVRYALFRPDLTMEDKRRFLSERAGVALNIRLSPPQARMSAIAAFKHRSRWYIGGAGLPMPEIRAIFLPEGPAGNLHHLPDAAAIADWLRSEGAVPCFGKPVDGTYSIGGAAIVGVEDGGKTLRLGNDTTIGTEEFAASVIANFRSGYLFQPILRMHPVLAPYCGTAAGSMRVVTLWSAGGPEVLYTGFKLPPLGGMVDGPTKGHPSAFGVVDPASGLLLRSQYNNRMNLEAVTHAPATGLPLEGLVLPDMAAALALACAAHRLFPTHGIFGADVILTDTGPVLNEMNISPTHSIYQRGADRALMNPDFAPRLQEAERLVTERLAARRRVY